jgi:hypothetical protein
MSEVSAPAVASKFRLNGFQKFWLIFQPALFVGAIGLEWFRDPDEARLFWAEPMGLKLAAWASALSVLNFVILLGGCLALNRIAESLAKAKWVVQLSQGLLYFGCMFFLALPALFNLLIGPVVVKNMHYFLSP